MSYNTPKKIVTFTIALTISTILSILAGCGGASTGHTVSNRPPVITIQRKQVTAMQNTQVQLSALVVDREGDDVDMQWTQVTGTEHAHIEFDTPEAMATTLTAPSTPGTYTLRFSATDQKGATVTAEATLVVESIEQYLAPQLEELMQSLYNEYQSDIANLAFMVNFKTEDYIWQGAAGQANLAQQTPMTVDHPFRIASISKTITAALALKFVEFGFFTLDTPISEILEDTDMPEGYTVADLHSHGGVKRGGSLTIRQFLDQSTGILDFVSYLTNPQAPDSLSIAAVLNPGSTAPIPALWSPQLIFQNILDRGLTKNLNHLPGEAYTYGNSNTDILGIVLEKVGGAPLHQLMENHIFSPLQMTDTYMDFHQPAKGQRPVDHFYLVNNETHGSNLPTYLYGNHNIKALNMNTSFAWAGGGIVSTLGDLNKLFSSIEDGSLITDTQLQSEWQNWRGAFNQENEEYYALGRHHGQETFGINDDITYRYVGHTGAWGSYAFDIDPIGVRIIAWDSQAGTPISAEFISEVLHMLADLGFNNAP